jgi:DNA primase
LLEIKKFNPEAWLEDRGIGFRRSPKNWFILKECPFCSRKNTGGIDPNGKSFKCFSAKCSAGPDSKCSIAVLVSHVAGISMKEAIEITRDGYDFDLSAQNTRKEEEIDNFVLSMLGDIKSRQPEIVKSAPTKEINKPHFFKTVTEDDSEAVEYLESRGISLEMARDLDVQVWESDKRVAFMIETFGMTYGYVARDYTGRSPLKVRNSEGNFRSNAVWNYDRVCESETLVICEGIFSAIGCGIDRSIATLGAEVSPGQVELISQMKAKTVYIYFDVDADNMALNLFDKLSPFFDDIRIVRVPAIQTSSGSYKDAADFTPEENQGFLDEAKSPDMAELLMRKLL